MQKYLVHFFSSILCLLTLAACGGGGGGTAAGNTNNGGSTPTSATLKINLTGTLPAGSAISGATFTIILPANVTPATTNAVVNSGVVANSGTFAGSSLSPQVVYSAASGTLNVILTNSVAGGVTQVGEVATITLQLANSALPTADSFGISNVSVINAANSEILISFHGL